MDMTGIATWGEWHAGLKPLEVSFFLSFILLYYWVFTGTLHIYLTLTHPTTKKKPQQSAVMMKKGLNNDSGVI